MADQTLTDITRNWAKGVIIGDALNRAAGKAGAAIVGRARAYVSGRVLNRRSGNLLESIRFQVDNTSNGIQATVMAGGGRHKVQYAAIHEYGGTVRPMTIFGYLRKADGSPWEIKIPKRSYIAPAVKDVKPLIPRLIGKEIDKALGVTSGR